MGVLRRDPEPTRPNETHEIHSILGPESSFDGKLTFRGTVRVDGRFNGEIRADGSLIVGQDARLAANVYVGHLVVFGEVEGDLHATQGIEIHASAKVRGNISAPQVMVEKGALFEGSCRMRSGEETATLGDSEPQEADEARKVSLLQRSNTAH